MRYLVPKTGQIQDLFGTTKRQRQACAGASHSFPIKLSPIYSVGCSPKGHQVLNSFLISARYGILAQGVPCAAVLV
jgi:hypothetical protein